jgi:hypothetical protein
MTTFTVKHNNGRDIWLETVVPVTAEYAPDREYIARREVRLALEGAARTFPIEWPRDVADWCRVEWADSLGKVVVRMPAAYGRHILALQEAEPEELREAAS